MLTNKIRLADDFSVQSLRGNGFNWIEIQLVGGRVCVCSVLVLCVCVL